MGRKSNQKKKYKVDITALCIGDSSTRIGLEPNQYVRDHEIVTRCSGFAVLKVNGAEKARTTTYNSGGQSRSPGANWTGILADVNGQRFGRTISKENRFRLKTCAEGKCLYDLLDNYRLKSRYFRLENTVNIEIFITYDCPCHVCDVAIPVWIDQWAHLCKSLNVVVQGRGKYVYPSA